MKILIIGPQGTGKSTLRAKLELAFGFKGYSTSDFLIYRMSERIGRSVKSIRRKKAIHRAALVSLGNTLCDVDPGVIVSAITFAAGDNHVIIDGVRRRSEFDKVRNLFDIIFYVDRSLTEYKPDPSDNFELLSTDGTRLARNEKERFRQAEEIILQKLGRNRKLHKIAKAFRFSADKIFNLTRSYYEILIRFIINLCKQ